MIDITKTLAQYKLDALEPIADAGELGMVVGEVVDSETNYLYYVLEKDGELSIKQAFNIHVIRVPKKPLKI